MACSPKQEKDEDAMEEIKDPQENISKIKCQQSIMFLNDSIMSSKNLKMIKIRHPKLERRVMVLIDEDKQQLYELNVFDEGHRSWFIEETVQSDGRLYFTTLADPTYFILPYIMQARKNIPLDQLLEDKSFPYTGSLCSLINDLSHVADMKGTSDLNVWKYNESKTLEWLAKRAEKLSVVLKEEQEPVSAEQSIYYVKTMEPTEAKEKYLQLAHSLISEYLSAELSAQLRKKLNLPDSKPLKKKAQSPAQDPAKAKKAKVEAPTEDYSKDKLPTQTKLVPSAKSKALAKSAVGTKSIMSFFSRK